MKILLTIPAMLLVILLAACGSARKSEPIRGPLDLTDKEVRAGMKVFMKYCYQCHPGGEGGLGPAINNKPLPEFMIKYQVRHGVGSMPSFSEANLSDKDLENVVEFIKALRKHDGP